MFSIFIYLFGLLILSDIERGILSDVERSMLKSFSVIVNLSMFFLNSANFCFTHTCTHTFMGFRDGFILLIHPLNFSSGSCSYVCSAWCWCNCATVFRWAFAWSVFFYDQLCVFSSVCFVSVCNFLPSLIVFLIEILFMYV